MGEREQGPGACPACSLPLDPGTGACVHCTAEPDPARTRAGRRPANRPPQATAAPLVPGALVADRYRVDALLGRGGYGDVHAAWDTLLDRDVALKRLHSGRERERFLREARALARLDHLNVVKVHDVVHEGEHDVLVMERVAGESLSDLFARGPLPWAEMARIAHDLAAALEHAHDAGVLHRDLKPANVLLTPEGVIKLTDFGIARVEGTVSMTDQSTLLGTTPFMAPEIMAGEEPDGRADLYALGVTAYVGLTGRLPIEGASVEELLARVPHEEPPSLASLRPDVSPAFAELVHRCLAKRPQERPSSARAFRLELAELLSVVAGVASAREMDGVPVRLHVDSIKPPSEGEKRRAVVVALDWRHLEDLAEEWEPDALERHARSLREELCSELQGWGGLVAEQGPESLLVVFGLPVSGERDVDRALDFADAVLRRFHDRSREGATIRLGAAVHRGQLVAAPRARRYRLRSDAARTVRRLAEEADDGEVRLSRELVASLRDRTRCTRREAADEAEPHRLVRQREPRAPRASVLPLVGRDLELRQLTEMARAAADGRGLVVTVEGPAGVGKSRLLHEAFTSLADDPAGFRRVLVEAPDASARVPGRLFALLLAELQADEIRTSLERSQAGRTDAAVLAALRSGDWSDEAVSHLDGEERNQALRPALTRLVASSCAMHPLALFFEDLHWCDETSQDLLAHLAGVVPSLPLLLVTSSRPDWRPPWTGRAHHRPIALGPLSPESERELVQRYLDVEALADGVARALSERSGGNPLFALEQARALRERGFFEGPAPGATGSGAHDLELDTPASVEAIVAARIDALPQSTQRLLQGAAVIGQEVDAELLASLLEWEEKEVQRIARGLVARDFLQEQPLAARPTWRFQHAVLREVAHDRILAARRRELHGRVAAALAARHEDPLESIPDRMGWHLSRSDERERAVPYLQAAADRAGAAGALSHATELVEQALAIVRDEGDRAGGARAECELNQRLAAHHSWRGDREAAVRAGQAAVAAGKASGDARLITRGYLSLARAHVSFGALAEALATLDVAEPQAVALGDADLMAELAAGRANVLIFSARLDEAASVLDRVEAAGETPPARRVVVLRYRAMIHYRRGENDAALAAIDEGLELADSLGDRVRHLWFLSQRCNVLVVLGRGREMLETARAALSEARQAGLARQEVFLGQFIAYQRWQAGSLKEALEGSEHALGLARELGEPWFIALALKTRGLVLHEAGRHGPALAALREAAELTARLDMPESHGNSLLALAGVAITLGLEDEADACLREARDLATRHEDRFQRCAAAMLELRARRVAHGLESADREAARALEELGRDCGEPESLVPALCEVARVEASDGSASRAIGLALEALSLVETSERGVDVPRAHLALSEARLAEGALDEAVREAEEAVAVARSQGQPELEWEAEHARARALEAAGRDGSADAIRRARDVVRSLSAGLGPAEAASFRARPDRAALLGGAEGGLVDVPSRR